MQDPSASFPNDRPWAAHLTPAAVDFIARAEEALFAVGTPLLFWKLREVIDRVKDGRERLAGAVEDLDAFIENL